MRFGEYLVRHKYLSSGDLNQLLLKQKELASKNTNYTELGNLILTFTYMDEATLCQAVNEYRTELADKDVGFNKDLPYISTDSLVITQNMLDLIHKNFELITTYGTLPYFIDENSKEVTYLTIQQPAVYDEFIARFTQVNNLETYNAHVNRAFEYTFARKIQDLGKIFGRSMVSRFRTYEPTLNDKINLMFRSAVNLRASDVIIEPLKDYVRVKFKVDGVGRIYDKEFTPTEDIIRIANIIIGMCGLAGTVLQEGTSDGSIDSLFGELDKKWSARVNIVDTIYGPKLTFRLIPNEQAILTLNQLGMPPQVEQYVKENARKSAGLVLITGHMGSGKNTTIYASLLEMDHVALQIGTYEDPVERRLPNISQTDVSGKLDFHKVSQAVVRQALDVLFMGEIRDRESLDFAVELSGAGVLVWSTLHIDRVAQVWSRVYSLNPAILTRFITNLQGIMTQRLVRRICPECKKEITQDGLSDFERNYLKKAIFGVPGEGQSTYRGKLFKGAGCTHCQNTGYKGLTVVTEIFPLNNKLKLELSSISNFVELENFTDIYMERNKLSFKYQGAIALNAGITTVEELARVNMFDFNID